MKKKRKRRRKEGEEIIRANASNYSKYQRSKIHKT